MARRQRLRGAECRRGRPGPSRRPSSQRRGACGRRTRGVVAHQWQVFGGLSLDAPACPARSMRRCGASGWRACCIFGILCGTRVILDEVEVIPFREMPSVCSTELEPAALEQPSPRARAAEHGAAMDKRGMPAAMEPDLAADSGGAQGAHEPAASPHGSCDRRFWSCPGNAGFRVRSHSSSLVTIVLIIFGRLVKTL